ncbi:MAG: hypothetical protein KDB80_04160 [Planctomycetes bacterium]|nr:hypothetical protein [Planctomycetota bacterium]
MNAHDEPHTSSTEPARTRSSRLEFGDVIASTLSAWFRHWPAFSALSIVVFSPYVAYGFWRIEHGDSEFLGTVEVVIGAAFLFLLCGVLVEAVFRQLHDDRFEFGSAIARGFRAIPRALGACAVTSICFVPIALAVGVGTTSESDALVTVMGIAAALIGAIALSAVCLAVCVAVIERRGPIASIRRSLELTRGIRGQILRITIVLSILAMVPFLRFGFLIARSSARDGGFTMPWLELGIALVIAPILAILPIVIYHDARQSKEGIDAVA